MKRNKIYAWMAAAMTLAACSTNDIADITANDADNIVNIASVTRSGEGGTATSTMTAPFHLVNVTQQTNYGWKCEADYTYNSSTSQYARKDGDLVVWCNIKSDNSSERMVANEFQAFSPLRTVANEASYTTFQILPDQSTADKLAAADWMTATTTSTKAAATDGLSLNFVHKNAKLHFDVTLKDDAAALTVNDNTAALTSNNFKVLGTITPYYNSTDNSKTIDAIVEADKDYSGVNLIEVTIDGDTYAAPIPSNLLIQTAEGTQYNFEEGKQYNFDLVIGHDQATISSVSVTDWEDDSIDLNGNDDALLEGYKVNIDPVTGVRTFTVSNYNAFKLWSETNDVAHTNITLDGDITVPDGETFPHINWFEGTFDGNGHTIKTTLYHSESQDGLLINSNNGTIKNLNVEIVNGTTNLNGIVFTNNDTIVNCTIKGNITTSEFAYGISRINHGIIIACTNNANFSNCSYNAGFCAKSKGTIIGCINNGNTISAGITFQIGYDFWNSPGTMISCVNTGTISSGKALYNSFYAGSTIKHCYWTNGDQTDSNFPTTDGGGKVTGGWTEEIINNLNTATDGEGNTIQAYGYEFKAEDGKLIIVPYTPSSSSSAARR